MRHFHAVAAWRRVSDRTASARVAAGGRVRARFRSDLWRRRHQPRWRLRTKRHHGRFPGGRSARRRLRDQRRILERGNAGRNSWRTPASNRDGSRHRSHLMARGGEQRISPRRNRHARESQFLDHDRRRARRPRWRVHRPTPDDQRSSFLPAAQAVTQQNLNRLTIMKLTKTNQARSRTQRTKTFIIGLWCALTLTVASADTVGTAFTYSGRLRYQN